MIQSLQPVRLLAIGRASAALCAATLTAFCSSAPASNSNASNNSCEFGRAESLGPLVNSPAFDGSPTVSADETELFFTSGRNRQQDIFRSTRSSPTAAWGAPANLGALVNDPAADDFSLRLSTDGTKLYFASTRTGGYGKADMYVATRESRNSPWGRVSNLGPPLNTEAFEAFPTPSADGRSLYFNRSTTFDSEDSDIWVTTRARQEDQWTEPQRVSGGINSERAEFSPALAADGYRLYFASGRSGSIDVWMSTRPGMSGDWAAPIRLGATVNVPRSMTLAPFISSDLRSLYFMAALAREDMKEACTPATCFDRLDLYVAHLTCPPGVSP